MKPKGMNVQHIKSLAAAPDSPQCDLLFSERAAPDSLRSDSHLSRLAGYHFHNDAEGIKAMSRRLRSAATTPPVLCVKEVRIPQGCQRSHRSVQKTTFIFYSRLFQKLIQLFAERSDPVMSGLVLDVSLHTRAGRRAHRERTISFLPCKSAQLELVAHTNGRSLPQVAHEVRQTMRGLQSNKQVDMVGNAAGTLRNSSESRRRAADVFVQTFAPRFCNQRRARLCGEHDVVMQGEKRRWHGWVWRLASLRDAFVLPAWSGGIASLNHRLIALMPSVS